MKNFGAQFSGAAISAISFEYLGEREAALAGHLRRV